MGLLVKSTISSKSLHAPQAKGSKNPWFNFLNVATTRDAVSATENEDAHHTIMYCAKTNRPGVL